MKFLRPYFLCVLMVIFLCNYCNAQAIPDSLLHKLNTAANDSVKARTLLDIGETIEATLTEKSFDYYQQALALSKKIKNNRLILSSLNDVGICYIELNKLNNAIITLQQAVAVAKQLNDTLRIAKILTNIGNVYLGKSDRFNAIEYYLQSARLWETAADQKNLPGLYSNICSLLSDQKEYDKSLEYGNKAFVLAQKIGDDYSAVNALLNLSNTYSNLGKFEKEYELLQQALPLAKKGKDIEQIATVYHNLGDYYYQEKQYQPSLTNYLESHNYVLQMGNKYHLCTSFSMLALVYHKLDQNDKALQYILQAEKLAGEVGARADLKQIYLTRSEIEKRRGNPGTAYDYLYKASEIKDSLFKVETSERVADAEAKYQNEKKQQEILQLEKDKQIQALSIKQKSILNYFLTGSVAALLIVGFLGYRNLRNRQQLAKQQDELQQQQIRELEKDKQLVAVDSMLKGQEDERSRLAKDLHDGLGGLLSGVKFSLSNMKDNLIITPDNMAVFERSLDMIDTSIKELRRVAHNMMPEMLTKFGLDEALKEYCNSINSTKLLTIKYQSLGMEARFDKSVEIIIYRIVQELLNNVIKHAAATEAFVQLIKEGSRLNVVVEDNGKGFDVNLPETNKGAGLTNVRSRVEYLKGQLDIHADTGKGTLVNIEFII
ncbi:MAG: sensor histidine kinase [Ginsengibacter sp.]